MATHPLYAIRCKWQANNQTMIKKRSRMAQLRGIGVLLFTRTMLFGKSSKATLVHDTHLIPVVVNIPAITNKWSLQIQKVIISRAYEKYEWCNSVNSLVSRDMRWRTRRWKSGEIKFIKEILTLASCSSTTFPESIVWVLSSKRDQQKQACW